MDLLKKAAISTLLLSLAVMIVIDLAWAERLPTFGDKIIGGDLTHREKSSWGPGIVIDLNRDGIPEIVQTYSNIPGIGPNRAEPIKILEAKKNIFSYEDSTDKFITNVPSLVNPRVFARGDFNSDGIVDLFVGGHGYDTFPFPGEVNWLILSSANAKHTGIVAPPKSKTFTHSTAGGDINRDGIADIYAGPICCGVGPHFLKGRKNQLPIFSNSELPSIVKEMKIAYTSASLVDLDGENGVDLVLGNGGDNNNVVYLNNGKGNFNKIRPDILLPPGLFGQKNTVALDIFPSDFDYDGKQDLLILQTSFKPFYKGYGLQLLKNQNGNSFSDITTASFAQGSGKNINDPSKAFIYPADFYGDGIVDFVIFGSWPTTKNTNILWINDGSGRFTPFNRSLFDTSDIYDDANLIYAVDVNKDGRSDLIRVVGYDSTTDKVYTYLNNGLSVTGLSLPLQILRQPSQTVIKKGASLNLSVLVRGQRPLKFQWYKDGSLITGANRPIFTVSKTDAKNSGNYYVKIESPVGKQQSSTAKVVIQ